MYAVKENLGVLQKMNRIAAVVDSLGPTQSSFYLIKEFNNLAKDTNYAPICFYNNLSPPVVKPHFATMNISYYATYYGCTIANSVETANLVLKTQNSSRKFFYVWDLEWLRRPIQFTDVVSIMRDKRIELITRSQYHKDLIEKYANREVAGIVDNWNMQQLEEIVWTPAKS